MTIVDSMVQNENRYLIPVDRLHSCEDLPDEHRLIIILLFRKESSHLTSCTEFCYRVGTLQQPGELRPVCSQKKHRALWKRQLTLAYLYL